MTLLQELIAIKTVNEAKKPQAIFKKYTDFASWNDDNGTDYDETEIDGYLVGVLYDAENVIGLWYNRANVGSISYDFAEKFPSVATDVIAYCEKDPYWPYGD